MSPRQESFGTWSQRNNTERAFDTYSEEGLGLATVSIQLYSYQNAFFATFTFPAATLNATDPTIIPLPPDSPAILSCMLTPNPFSLLSPFTTLE